MSDLTIEREVRIVYCVRAPWGLKRFLRPSWASRMADGLDPHRAPVNWKVRDTRADDLRRASLSCRLRSMSRLREAHEIKVGRRYDRLVGQAEGLAEASVILQRALERTLGSDGSAGAADKRDTPTAAGGDP